MVAAGGIAGCDVGDAAYQTTDTPDVHVVHVLGTLALKADGTPEDPQEIAADGSTRIVPSSSIRLRFDRFLLPSSISRQALCLRASTDDVPNYTKCLGGVFLQPSYDPVRREVVLRLQAGDLLALGTLYKLTLYQQQLEGDCTSDNPTSCGILAFDRAPLEKAFTILFRTVETDPGPAKEVAVESFCGDKGAEIALGATCAYSGCHYPNTGKSCVPTKEHPYTGCAEGLGFSNLQNGEFFDTQQTAINRVAHQTMEGESASTIEKTPTRFGRAMPIIDAFDPGKTGNPGNSYIMYKILTGISIDAAPDDIKPSAAEVKRLRDSVVVGMPMPAMDGSTGPLDAEQLLNVSDWIAHGAPFKACP